MRHKYHTPAIVLTRIPIGEAHALLTLLSREVGLVRARAQSVRKSGARLAAALATLCESNTVLVRGKEGWRVSGAVLDVSWFRALPANTHMRVSRVAGLLSRLVPQEVNDPRVFEIFAGFLEALKTKDGTAHDAIECLAVLHLLSVLGLDRGEVPSLAYSEQMLETISRDRQTYVLRINHGITASGL